ncbi:SDR family NAD(P)-dependent oxidoreductase [Pseudonocardia sp. 73-21]|uniref:SDR family NAD(P)-dependent oxidoreductase n=1 Tax=unclassified Pseudonocardia TaxID=2619320 RepID=UPI003427E4DD
MSRAGGPVLTELAKRLKADCAEVDVIEADITDEAAARGAFGQAVARFGWLDIVVANASVILLARSRTRQFMEWQRMVDIKVLGLLFIANPVLPHLLEAASAEKRRVADLVLISSAAGRVPPQWERRLRPHQARSRRVRRVIARGGGQAVIRVSLIEPSAVTTELAGHNRPEVQEGCERGSRTMERTDAVDIAGTVWPVGTRCQRHPPASGRDQRGAHPPDRTGAVRLRATCPA